MLLQYFGEENPTACGQCDVCLSESDSKLTDKVFNNIRQTIINQLKDGAIEASKLNLSTAKPQQAEMVLDYMRAREEILMEGRFLRLGVIRD